MLEVASWKNLLGITDRARSAPGGRAAPDVRVRSLAKQRARELIHIALKTLRQGARAGRRRRARAAAKPGGGSAPPGYRRLGILLEREGIYMNRKNSTGSNPRKGGPRATATAASAPRRRGRRWPCRTGRTSAGTSTSCRRPRLGPPLPHGRSRRHRRATWRRHRATVSPRPRGGALVLEQPDERIAAKSAALSVSTRKERPPAGEHRGKPTERRRALLQVPRAGSSRRPRTPAGS